ncbi:hypothetical protein [Staphylococcus phage vB_SauM-V1SA22]|nr:hypothetical protein [Staphylococcus phage vB_SauM-V1SA22]
MSYNKLKSNLIVGLFLLTYIYLYAIVKQELIKEVLYGY